MLKTAQVFLGFPSEVMVWSGRHGSRAENTESNSCQRHP